MQQVLAAFLALIAAPLVKKVLIALGFGFVSYASLNAFKSALDSAISAALSAINPSVYQVMALAGFVDIVGIWLGAFTFVIAFLAVKKLRIINL